MRIVLFSIMWVCGLLNSGCDDSSSTSEVTGPNGTDMSRSIASDSALDPIDADTGVPVIDGDQGVMQGSDAEAIMEVDCTPNEVVGCVDISTQRVCDTSGSGYVEATCADDERCDEGDCVPSVCVVGEHVCIDDRTVGGCRRDETGYIPIRTCDEGSVCENGRCASSCNPLGKVPSNIGCEYWSVDLDNYPDPFSNDPSSVPHAVVISNTSTVPATVTIEGPAVVPLVDPQFVVADGDVHVFTFPRLDIDGTGIFDRAFKINSTQPVIVYQFNPLNNEGVASNDASLLLPKEGLGRDYVALSWPSGAMPCLDPDPANCLPAQSGYVTIIATSSGSTVVRVTPTVTVEAGGSVSEMPPGIEQEITLQEGEVLNLQALEGDVSEALAPCETNEDCASGICFGIICLPSGEVTSTDLTGSIISATQPIAVFGGHEEAVIGDGMTMGAGANSNCCAEHLEQQLLPVSSWGTHYLAARSEPRGGSNEHWRVVAQADGTVIQTVPPQPDSAQFTLNRGEFKEIVTPDSFEIIADAPVMVGEYLVSQGSTRDNVGDPALIVTPPINQLRSSYQIITPSGYSSNWLTVAREVGQSVTLDGTVISAARFTTFGSSQYELAWIEVNEGVHYLESETPFYLTVYGYSAAVSYGYPGGLNLRSDDM